MSRFILAIVDHLEIDSLETRMCVCVCRSNSKYKLVDGGQTPSAIDIIIVHIIYVYTIR